MSQVPMKQTFFVVVENKPTDLINHLRKPKWFTDETIQGSTQIQRGSNALADPRSVNFLKAACNVPQRGLYVRPPRRDPD